MNNDSTIRSATLRQAKALPETVCADCPNAIWHLILKGKKEELRIFCLVMHALIDESLGACDGTKLFPK